jgi:hypothetical protein
VFETFSDRNKNLIGGLLPKHKKVLWRCRWSEKMEQNCVISKVHL